MEGTLYTRFTIPTAKTVSEKLRIAVLGKRIQCRGRSYAASVPSETPKPKKANRISKDERRSMVESFVDKYREQHAGKFPPINEARKEVGGSHYLIRRIVQELEYKSKTSTGGVTQNVGTEYDPQEVTQNDVQNDISSKYVEVEEGQTCKKTLAKEEIHDGLAEREDSLLEMDSSHPLPGLGQDSSHSLLGKTLDCRSKDGQVDQPDLVEMDGPILDKRIDDQPLEKLKKSEYVEVQHVSHNFVGGEGHPSVEEVKDDGVNTSVNDLMESKSEKQKVSTELDEDMKDMASKQTNEELPERSLWGNLKSFADGIINIWRKR